MKVWVMTTIATQPRRLSRWRPSAAALGLALSCLAPAAAWAQLNSVVPGGGNMSRFESHSPDNKPTGPEPESVPGAKAREPAAPPTHAAGDMQPNDALFDAINRGDITAARDALNRGADMNAVNILGMTPMELSVDLGRNDISFLLLSMRGEDSDRGARAVGRDVPALKSTPPARIAATAKTRGRTKAIEAPVATKPIAVPKLFANDGGTPQPNAGFLGFDARSATN
jgi:hypothetical protein